MQVTIEPRSLLTPEVITHLGERVRLPEHADDGGPARYWDWESYIEKLYVAVATLDGANVYFAILTVDGPKDACSPSWWIDSQYRGRRWGVHMVDALANFLRSRGYTGTAPIYVQTYLGRYDAQSATLVKRMRCHLPAAVG